MIKILIENINSKIIGYLPDEVSKDINKALSYEVANARHMPSVKNGKWDGVVRLYKRSSGQQFYTGLLSFIRDIFKKHNVEFKLDDRRVRPAQNLPNLEFNPPKEWNYEERDYQTFTIERALKFTRGILGVCTGGGKCLGKGTKVLMYDGNIKLVEDIKVGDLLMGPDSTPRKVLTTTHGIGELYLVKQNNGDDFVCNDEHIFCLQNTRKDTGNEEIQITASDYYKSTKRFKHRHKGYKTGVDFPVKEVLVDPYWLGLWLGDGSSKHADITTGDSEIVDYLCRYAQEIGLHISVSDGTGCKTYKFVQNPRFNLKKQCCVDGCLKKSNSNGMCRVHYGEFLKNNKKVGHIFNHLKNKLSDLNVIDNKHIPDCYKFNSRENRLKLLAGILDSDGSFSKVGAVEFCNINKKLAEDVCWLARSLGFRSSLKEKIAKIKKINYTVLAYRVRIGGKISDIPLLLKRKQAGDKTKYLDVRYGIDVSPIGNGEYFGFEIDGDRKFLLGDFTVTHNTVIVTRMIAEIKTAPFIFYVLTKDLMYQAHETMVKCLNEPIGMIGDGQCDIKNINVMTIQTAIRALNNKKKFNVKDYKFDEEDVWEEEDVDEETSEKIQRLIRSAKGIYLDETHHAAANTCVEVLEASSQAYWRFGGSATPYRESGDEILIQAMFGGKIVEISASYLIKRGYLIKPYIFMVPVDSKVDLHTYQKIYKHCISENNQLNDYVAELAKFLNKIGLSNLILVQHYPQGNYIKSKLGEDVQFVTGKMTTKNRKGSISDLRTQTTACMIATSLADEGLDIPVLDSVTMAGGGASATRVNQRIGRTLRKSNSVDHEKTRSVVVIFEHNARFLDSHAKKIRRILKKEPEFEVINSKGMDFLFDEISDKLGIEKENDTIFEL